LQGEREMATGNKTLARFILDGIPPASRGTPQVEVTFDIDANGILSVKAVDKATSKSQSIRVEATTSLSKEEIEKLKKEATLHAEEDRKKKDLVETKNKAENLIYVAEKSLNDVGDKVAVEIKESVKSKIEVVREAAKSDDKSTIEAAVNELSQELQKIGSSLYNKGDGQ